MKQLLKTIKCFIICVMFLFCINISMAETDVYETIMDNTHIPAAQMEQNDSEENESDDIIIPTNSEETQYKINQDDIEQNDNDDLDIIILLTIFCVIVSIYFFPTIVAVMRSHNNTLSIFVLNLFLGWTFIGWVVALVWGCYNSKQ